MERKEWEEMSQPLVNSLPPPHPIQEKLGLSLDHKSRIFQNLNGALGEETAMRKGAMREDVGGPECGWGSW